MRTSESLTHTIEFWKLNLSSSLTNSIKFWEHKGFTWLTSGLSPNPINIFTQSNREEPRSLLTIRLITINIGNDSGRLAQFVREVNINIFLSYHHNTWAILTSSFNSIVHQVAQNKHLISIGILSSHYLFQIAWVYQE